MSDRIVSHPSNDAYREGWERAFGDQIQWRTGYSRLDEAFGAAWSITSSATKGKDAGKHTCPICDSPMDYPPENHHICPRCYTEFGYDDSGASHAELREQWSMAS